MKQQIFIDIDVRTVLFSVGTYYPAHVDEDGVHIRATWEFEELTVNGADILGLDFVDHEAIEKMIINHIEEGK